MADKGLANELKLAKQRIVDLYNKLRKVETSGGGSGVQSVTGPGVDNTDPTNPVLKAASSTSEGVVDLVSNQQLGAGDKRINGKRIGTGGGNVSSNTVLGGGLASNSSGANNTAAGAFSLFANTTGSSNTAVGVSAMQSSTTSSGTTAVGHGAGFYSNGAKNTFIGVSAGQGDAVYTGVNNTAIGHAVGNKLGSGSNNTLVGSEAGTVTEGITTGSNNTIIGKTVTGVTTGSGNTLIGRITGQSAALTNNVIIADGAGNIAIQKSATHELTAPTLTNALIASGGNKSLITKEYFDANSGGGSTLQAVTTAGNTTTNAMVINDAYLFNDNTPNSEKVLFGKGTDTITATSIVAVGNNAGVGATGAQNVYFGNNAGQGSGGGFNSAYFGYSAGAGNTGNAGTFIGAHVGTKNTGSSCTLLGRGFFANTFNNVIGLGDGNSTSTVATANNQIVFGINSRNIRFNGAVSADKLYDFPAANTGTLAVVGTVAPATATSTGATGEIRVTSTFIYCCVATNTWVRAALASW